MGRDQGGPVSEVELGDKVEATDPTTGQTTDRTVVATIVHTDEDDMTRLAVTDGTSPVVTDVDRYTRSQPVYDLTIQGVHTY